MNAGRATMLRNLVPDFLYKAVTYGAPRLHSKEVVNGAQLWCSAIRRAYCKYLASSLIRAAPAGQDHCHVHSEVARGSEGS